MVLPSPTLDKTTCYVLVKLKGELSSSYSFLTDCKIEELSAVLAEYSLDMLNFDEGHSMLNAQLNYKG